MARDIHEHRILILDFGSQYTQLIARRIREIGVYCEIWPWDSSASDIGAFAPRGIILSGGPESVHAADGPQAPQVPGVIGGGERGGEQGRKRRLPVRLKVVKALLQALSTVYYSSLQRRRGRAPTAHMDQASRG